MLSTPAIGQFDNKMFCIPNLLTLANLICGCCAILHILYFDPVTAAWFTFGSFVFDYADGMVARALHQSSPLGKELDSLADVVSFGVAPGAMFYQMLSKSFCGGPGLTTSLTIDWICYPALAAFVLTAFSALRLAKFNIDTRQTTYFLGLSTPACTVFVMGISLAAHKNLFDLGEVLSSPWFVFPVIAALCALLVSEIPMFGMKLKKLGWRENLPLLSLLALGGVAIFFFKQLGLSVMIILYIIGSIIFRDKI